MSSSSTRARLRPPDVLAYAEQEIVQAAGSLWTGRLELGAHVPSITGYVQQIAMEGHPALFAKTSILGASLVSVLRGVHGTWSEVQHAQRAYAARADSLLHREAAQLRLLAQLGAPRVCTVAGIRRGVLITARVPGPNLADLITARPRETAPLMEEVLEQLEGLHRQSPARLGTAGTMERSIRGTFSRKFGPDTPRSAYMQQIGAQLPKPAHRAVVRLLAASVTLLLRCRPAPGPTVLAYGDLKPEHVIFPADGGGPVFVDPGLRPAGASEDLARLISRTLLMAVTQLAPGAAAHAIDGVRQVIESRIRHLRDREAWLHSLTVLWLMDTINILSTYLTAPPGLPLPIQARAAAIHAVKTAAAIHEVATALESTTASTAWDRAMTRVRRAAIT